MSRRISLTLFALFITCYVFSRPASAQSVELKHFVPTSVKDVRATAGVSFDRQNCSGGKGSIRVDAREPMIVPLYEVTDIGIENATLIYQACLQSENLDGTAFLEMWVRLPGRGEFFSRGLDRPVTGTMSWITIAAPFFLKTGQKPNLVRLNLIVQGKGRVWIDDVRLMRAPSPKR